MCLLDSGEKFALTRLVFVLCLYTTWHGPYTREPSSVSNVSAGYKINSHLRISGFLLLTFHTRESHVYVSDFLMLAP